MKRKSVRDFILYHFRHFNAAALVDAAEGYRKQVSSGGRMFMALAGADEHGRDRALPGGDDTQG